MSGIAFEPKIPPEFWTFRNPEYLDDLKKAEASEKSQGKLLIGIGENSGIPYAVVGSDGRSIESHDGAGNIVTCNPQGAGLTHVATGFWNPFAICSVLGRTYCVDNDPDASPPCRLIEVLSAGDYGFRFQYGRAGTHPLLAWNGELPGTLPAICGVGEAPTALVYHHQYLWVTSWGDHRLERYASKPLGTEEEIERSMENPATSLLHQASIGRGAVREVVAQGDEDFRPTGCAVAPDGSIYFSDWVSRSYPVHGHGRIWKLTLPMAQFDEPPWVLPFQGEHRNALYGLISWAGSGNLYEAFQAAIAETGEDISELNADSKLPASMFRLLELQRHRWHRLPDAEAKLTQALQDKDGDVRLFAVRWIADERHDGFPRRCRQAPRRRHSQRAVFPLRPRGD